MSSRPRIMPLIGLIFALVLAGCATSKYVKPDFDDSNQIFLEETIAELALTDSLRSVIPAGSRLALVSMERPMTTDHPIIALTEDVLNRQLLAAGYHVLERDADTLPRMIGEGGGDKYTVYTVPDAESTNGDALLSHETHLASAPYLVSYRVLECGLVYSKSAKRNMVERNSLARLHVRVLDTSNGEIMRAYNLTSKSTDTVAANLANDLATFHYTFYGSALPLEQGIPRGAKGIGAEERQKSSSNGGAAIAAVLVGGFVALVLSQ